MSGRDLPVRDPETFPAERTRPDASVHGVLLAAGTSSRYGDANKLLASLDGTPMVRHAASALVESAVDGVTVVVGHDHERVAAAVEGLDVTVRRNEAYAEGSRAGKSIVLSQPVESGSSGGRPKALRAGR